MQFKRHDKIYDRLMVQALYNAAILLALPLGLLYLFVQIVFYGKYRRSIYRRFGFISRMAEPSSEHGLVFWIHAVSVGEVMAAVPMIKKLRALYPDGRIVVSTVTETGQDTATQKVPEADQLIYFPFDLPWAVNRVIETIKPSIFIFMETEIWPNFFFALRRRRIPAMMVNGRISEHSYRGYKRLRSFFAKVLQGVAVFSVQTGRDAERLVSLGVDPVRVVKTGNMKYDQALVGSNGSSGNMEDLKRTLRLPVSSCLLLAGSTHDGEEEMIVDCYEQLAEKYPHLRLLLAPRHLDRIERIESLLVRRGFKPIRKTKLESSSLSELPCNCIIILDTLGELHRLYCVANIVFVGGSLVPVGGHNILEPAAYGKPVLFGGHMHNFSEIAGLLLEKRGALQVNDQEELKNAVERLLVDPDLAASLGNQAKAVVMGQQGVVERNLSLIRDLLGKH